MSPQEVKTSIEMDSRARSAVAAPSIAVTHVQEAIGKASPEMSSRTPSPADSALGASSSSTTSQASLTPQTSTSSESPPTSSPGPCDHADNCTLGGSTLAPSIPSSPTVPSPPASPAPCSDGRSQNHDRRSLLPDFLFTNSAAQNFMGLGVCALTIAGVVFALRSDSLAECANALSFWQACQSVNFNTPECAKLKGTDPPCPPYAAAKSVFTKLRVRSLYGQPSSSNGSAHSPSEPTSPSIAAAAACSLVAVVILLGATLIVRYRKQPRQVRISDQSMARNDFSRHSPAVATGREPQNTSGSRNRYRAFVTTEEALKQMKSGNESQSTLADSEDRRTSNPWSRRRSRLTGSNPSVLSNADVFHYDSDREEDPWHKVRHGSVSASSFESQASTLRPPPSAEPAVIQTEDETREDDPPPKMSRLKRWFTPGSVTIMENPPPELNQGDSGSAVALIGAGLAASAGGRAMAKCPVEVPFDPDKGLPDSWMHTCPQDDSSVT